ncbi:hypothetical protein Vadar_016595 [Vaccinium darrowii]|uniref:Uncharacterized protein n=1 Tax=Vaccinium darrowii TaxID=229202 RepID=A0ACB7X1G3_9ERIC|nr:hypothetical protein Vadar_016595 [Vaccinium darrowii]
MVVFLFSLFFLIYSASACDCVYQTKVAYTNAKALSSGACKYGPLALGFDGRHLAAAVPSFYKSGAGCGACYQIRCRNKAPLGPLQFQVGVMLGFDPAAITTQIALPANWTVGLIIDTGVQINYTNLEEGCPQCDNGGRK